MHVSTQLHLAVISMQTRLESRSDRLKTPQQLSRSSKLKNKTNKNKILGKLKTNAKVKGWLFFSYNYWEVHSFLTPYLGMNRNAPGRGPKIVLKNENLGTK